MKIRADLRFAILRCSGMANRSPARPADHFTHHTTRDTTQDFSSGPWIRVTLLSERKKQQTLTQENL